MIAAHGFPVRREGPDEAHQDGADGHGADEGARERPGDAGGPPVQFGQVLHEHARAPQDLAGQHGPHPQQERRPLRGSFFFYHSDHCRMRLGSFVLSRDSVCALHPAGSHVLRARRRPGGRVPVEER